MVTAQQNWSLSWLAQSI